MTWITWILALHLLSVFFWMAGVFYLPRLMAYHADTAPDSDSYKMLTLMERRLIRIIMTPAMLATWFFGLILLSRLPPFPLWLWIKLAAVLLLTAYHGIMVSHAKAFWQGKKKRPARFYRLTNEIGPALVALIVIMVIVRPF